MMLSCSGTKGILGFGLSLNGILILFLVGLHFQAIKGDTISKVWVATGICENCGMSRFGQLSLKVRKEIWALSK
jgi:hypothetical protein